MTDKSEHTPDDPNPHTAPEGDPSGARSIAPEGTPAVAREDEPAPRSRARWIAAAGAALGVALFAVPLLRGPDDGFGGAVATGTSCAVNKGPANLNFTLKDVKGGDVRLSDYKGKVILLNFWATWCGPCKVEIPEFVEAYDKYRDRGLVILGVLSEDDPSPQDLRDFTGQFKMNYPVLRPSEGLEAAFGTLWALPTSFIIDRHGSICSRHTGAVSKEMLEQEIKGLL